MPISEGKFDQEFRFDPIARSFVPENVTAEVQECILLPGLGGLCGFYLNELPLKESPSSVVVVRNYDSTVFNEVNTTPVGNQFFVDYHYPDRSNRGIVILPNSEIGNFFTISYKALGSVVHARNVKKIYESQFNSLQNTVDDIDNATKDLSHNGRYGALTTDFVNDMMINTINMPARNYCYVHILPGYYDIYNILYGYIIKKVGSPYQYNITLNDSGGVPYCPLKINFTGSVRNTNSNAINFWLIFDNVNINNSSAAGIRFHLQLYRNGVPLFSSITYRSSLEKVLFIPTYSNATYNFVQLFSVTNGTGKSGVVVGDNCPVDIKYL